MNSGHLSIVCAAILVLSCAQIGCGQQSSPKPEHKPIGVALTYQIIPEDLRAAEKEFDIQRFVDALNRRIEDYGVARPVGKDQFEVGLYGEPQEEALEQIKRRIGVRSKVEFRILADPTQTKDHEIIKLAKQLPLKEKDLKKGDENIAEWIAYPLKEFGAPDQANGMVKRMADVPEALVLVDALNIKGDYLTSATKGQDELGNLAIHFSLNHQGAELLRKLTSQNLPSPATPDVYRHLGIILNKRLLSAPTIRTTISDRGMISGGSMTEKEVDQTVETLNMGSLPIPFQLVDEKRLAK